MYMYSMCTLIHKLNNGSVAFYAACVYTWSLHLYEYKTLHFVYQSTAFWMFSNLQFGNVKFIFAVKPRVR